MIQLKLQNLLMIWEAAVWICVICWNFEFLMYLLILIGYFICFLALLCCFELLMYWWRNWWVESYWYKIFLCGIEVFECFEELFFAESFVWWFQCLASSRKVFYSICWCFPMFCVLLNFESWFTDIIHILLFGHFDRFFGIMLTLFR